MERELTRLLIEYDELETAWPKGRYVLVRARTGHQTTDMLLRIADLQNDIARAVTASNKLILALAPERLPRQRARRRLVGRRWLS